MMNLKTIVKPCTDKGYIPLRSQIQNKNIQSSQSKKLKPSERITVLNINCRSVKNKIPDLHQVISQIKPDVLCLTETWLKPEINTSEIFPDQLDYQVYRDDRSEGKGGGTLIAIKRFLTSQKQPQLKTNNNAVSAKLSIKGIRDIYISSFYKPNENDEESLNELWASIKQIPQNSTIWILGDFNMPSIDWSSEALTETCRYRNLYTNFLENLVNYNLQQMVTCPSRGSNTLDLFLTNMPAQVHSTTTLPPLSSSDHDIIFHEIKVNRGRPIQPIRNIKCFRKAKWDDLKRDFETFSSSFQIANHSDPNAAWPLFKDELTRLSSIHIPTKQTKMRRDLPWVNNQIIKLIRKRDQLYKRM